MKLLEYLHLSRYPDPEGQNYFKLKLETIDSHSIFDDKEYKKIAEDLDVYENFPKIIDWRRKFIPAKLYRYCPASKYRLSNLSGLVHFSTPREVNDILEVPVSDEDFEEGRAWCYENNDSMRDLARMACFSERFNNSAMWYHYASRHKGFCVEYDTWKLYYEIGTTSGFFRDMIWGNLELHEGAAHLLCLLPAIYSNNRYYLKNLGKYREAYRRTILEEKTRFPFIIESPNFRSNPDVVNLLRRLVPAHIIKTPDWDDEREWRILYTRELFENIKIFEPDSKNCLDFSSCITKVFLGLDASDSLKKKAKVMAKRMNFTVSIVKKDDNSNSLIEEEFFRP